MRPLNDESILQVRWSGGDARATALTPHEERQHHTAPCGNVPLMPYREIPDQPAFPIPGLFRSSTSSESSKFEKNPPHCWNNLTPHPE